MYKRLNIYIDKELHPHEEEEKENEKILVKEEVEVKKELVQEKQPLEEEKDDEIDEEEKKKMEEEEEEEEKQRIEEEQLKVRQPETVYHKNGYKAFRQKFLLSDVNVERATVYSKLLHVYICDYYYYCQTLILEKIEKGQEKESVKLYLEEFMKVYRNINLLLKSVFLLNQPKLMIDREFITSTFFKEVTYADLNISMH